MKFNLFDETTWAGDLTSKLLLSKVQSTIGNKVGELKLLKSEINNKFSNINYEYNIAENLKKSNFEVYKIMDIRYEYPDNNVLDILNTINQIISMWQDRITKSESINYKHIISLIQKIDSHIRNVGADLLDTKVNGNLAWDMYLSNIKEISDSNKKITDLSNKITILEDKIYNISQYCS